MPSVGSGLAVHLTVVEGLVFGDIQRVCLAIKFLEEAAVVSGVARATGLLDLEKEDVAIAVGKPAFDPLRVATGFTFEPELLS